MDVRGLFFRVHGRTVELSVREEARREAGGVRDGAGRFPFEGADDARAGAVDCRVDAGEAGDAVGRGRRAAGGARLDGCEGWGVGAAGMLG